jgi:hypothetical protein
MVSTLFGAFAGAAVVAHVCVSLGRAVQTLFLHGRPIPWPSISVSPEACLAAAACLALFLGFAALVRSMRRRPSHGTGQARIIHPSVALPH